MENLKCIIVDDEIMARKSLERLCKKTENLEVIAICENAEEAIDFLKKDTVDLIFLDIEMPGLTGIEFLSAVSILPQIIFTTSKTEYAFEAFQHQVTDYLQKPIDYSRFLLAVEKAVEIQKQNDFYKAAAEEVYIREEGKYIRVAYDTILYFENVGDYVKVVTDTGNHIIYSTLKSIAKKLNNTRFLKVHRSYIVNLAKIKDIDESSLVINRKVIPISRANRPVLMGRLNIL
jgi:DNA-binding LytR/AlgR family response regulator